MDYKRIYNEFIADRRSKEAALIASGEYVERHHILPRSLGGGDEAENIIALTAGDHYFAHLCLAKIYGESQWFSVVTMLDFPGATKQRSLDKFSARKMVSVARERSAKMKAENTRKLHQDPNWAGGMRSEEARVKHSTAMKDKFSDGEYAADWNKKHAAGLKEYLADEERVEARAENMRKWAESPEGKAHYAEFGKRSRENNPMYDPEVIAKVAAKSKEYHNRPEVRAAKSARVSGDKNPAKRPDVKAAIAKKAKDRNRLLQAMKVELEAKLKAEGKTIQDYGFANYRVVKLLDYENLLQGANRPLTIHRQKQETHE